MLVSIPISQPRGIYMFDRAYKSIGEKNNMYLVSEEVPRKTIKAAIKYLKNNHKWCILEELNQ